MANEFRVRKKLIVNGSGSTILDVQGSQGQLFSVTDSLSGSLFSVKDISGIPVIEAFSDDTVNIGTFNAEAIKVSGSFARITGSLLGTASWSNNAVTSSFAQTAQTLLGSVVSASYAGTASVLLGSVTSASYAATASFAFTSSYAINMIVSGGLTDVDYIQFDTASTVADAIGRLKYDSGEGTLQLGLAGGNVIANIGEDLYQYVYNNTGNSLTKGQVVYISGSQGNRIAVKLASAVAEQGSANTLGFAAETISIGAEGWIQTEGSLRKLNTSGLIGGKAIYLSSSAGQYTQTRPIAPTHTVILGFVERVDATLGSVYVKIDNGYELGELHDVIDSTTSSSYGDLLVKSGSVWINSKQLTGSYGLTGSLRATTINTTYLTASGNNYPTNTGTSSYFLQTDGTGNLSWNYVRSVLESVKNIGATTLVKGTPVYVTSSVGNTAEIVKADAASASLMPATYILNETLTAGQQGLGIVLGFINNIDTSTFNESDEVYVAAGGGYTNIQPTGSVLIQPLGTVVRVDNTNGSIMVSNTGLTNSLPNINPGYAWIGDSNWLPTAVSTSSFNVTSASYSITSSYALDTPISYIDNLVTVGLVGSDTQFNSIKAAVDSITDASANNTYTVRVYPGVYIEDTITMKSYITVKGDSSTSTVVSASNPSASIFVMADQTMVIDMQIQGSTGPGASAIYYSSPTTPQTNAIAYAENVRFGTNYTNASCIGSGSGNCILQCSNVKYGGSTDASLKSFDIGFRVSGSGGNIGRMQLRNVTSTNGGVAGTDNNQIFALAEAPGCTFIVNGCLLTRATGAARGTGFKVYNGGQLRLTAVNFQRWINGIWAPQTGSAPSIDAIALNFENCTTDVLIEHTGSTGKVSGTDSFLKTQIALAAPLYEVGQDPRRITVGTKGADFTSISASVAWISGSNENNRYVIEVGPGQFTEKTIDLTGKPYVSIVGSNIQTTQIFPSSSNQHIVKMGVNNELSFLSLANAGPGYSGIYVDNVGDFAQVHKVSIYDCDRGLTVLANSEDTQFYAEYVDINGTFTYGAYISSSNGASVSTTIENYYLFPSASATIGNFVTGPSSSLSLYTAKFLGDGTTNSTAIRLENGCQLEGAAIDIQDWDYGYVVPNIGTGPNFRVVGSMIHDTTTYDFDVQNITTRGRYQGVSNHEKINNVSEDFYWNFLDDADGENDVTRKLSVTFADGTHTDATTLIFRGSPMGVLQGGEITISGSLTVTTATGFGYLHDPINVEVFKRFDWVDGDITLSPNTNNYIYINSNGILSAAGSTPNYAQNIILGRVVTNSTGIEFIDQSPWNAEHTANAISKFNREALGPVFAEGSIISEDATPFKLDVTQGSYFFSENNFLPAGTSSINLTQYYQSASVWARYTSSVVPNNVYASGSALVPMSASYYTKHTVYLVGDGADEEYFLVVNNNQYSSLVSTENADLPTIPTYFNDGVVPLAAVYVQSGSANITQIQDIRPIIGFRAAGVNASSVHGNLLGLTADDHLQYLRVDGFREMSGDLGLGGNNLYNVASVSASAITSSEASITNIIAVSITGSLFGNATSADFATSASFTSTASLAISSSYAVTASRSISSSFARTSSLALSFFTSSVTSASFASTASLALSFFTSSVTSASYAATASAASNFVVGNSITASNALIINTITAQTLVVQTITASVEYSSGSNIFGSVLTNTHQFTGSVTITGSLSVVGQVSASGFTGSLLGTSSWARNSLTASYFFTSSVTSASFASTASYFLTSSVTSASFASTASLALNFFTSSVTSASFASTSSWANNFFTSSVTSASFASTASYFFTSSVTSASFASTASFVSTASWANNFFTSSVTSASFASTASYFFTSSVTSASFARTASLALNFFTGSVTSASFASTASYFLTSSVTSASFASTASLALNFFTSSVTSASFSSTASYFFTSSVTSASYALTASYALNAGGASAITVADEGTAQGTATFLNFTGAGVTATVSANTASINIPGGAGAAFPYTGSAQITGSLGVTGSVSVIDGGFTGSLFGTASWAQNAISSSFPITVTGSTLRSVSPAAGDGESTNSSIFFGSSAGATATNANFSNFFGTRAGELATSANQSNFFGRDAGASAASAANSNFFGDSAGASATNARDSNFFGNLAGLNAANANTSNFFGDSAGRNATVANSSNFFGPGAGDGATNARNSNFFGSSAGQSATSASYSTLIGFQVGFNAAGGALGIKSNNIIIGTNITLPNGRQDSINLGAIIFATGSYSNTAAANPFSGSVDGRVGINQLNPIFSLDVSGSGRYTNGLTVTGSLIAPIITGSLFGTSSWAVSASWAPGGAGGLVTKAGSVINSSFTGNPKKATVTFSTAFATTNYAITVTGEDARSWTIESKAIGSFVINSNSNTALAGTTYWHAIAYGEA